MWQRLFQFFRLHLGLNMLFPPLLVLLLAWPSAAAKLTVTHEATFWLEQAGYRANFSIGLFGEALPLTVQNFCAFVRGHKGLGYTGTAVHRISDDAMELGDVTKGSGPSRSIFGAKFADESVQLKARAGWVGMAGSGPNDNRSEFFVLRRRAPQMDGKRVIFGKVVRGLEVVQRMASVEVFWETGIPMEPTRVLRCEVRELQEPEELPEEPQEEL